MKISKQVLKVAKRFGVEFRVGDDPKKLKIEGVKKSFNKYTAVYFGHGVVWVNEPVASKVKETMDIILLHEIGHAILDFYGLQKGLHWKVEENMANAIALGLAAQYRIGVPCQCVKNFARLAKSKGNKMPKWVGVM